MRRRQNNHYHGDDTNNDGSTTLHDDRQRSSPNYVKATITPGYKDPSLHQTMRQMQTLKTSLRNIGYDPETKRQEKLQHLRQQNRMMVLPPSHELMTTTQKSATSSDRNSISNSKTNGRSITSGGYLGLSTARLQQARQSLKHKDKLRRRSVHHKYYNSASTSNNSSHETYD